MTVIGRVLARAARILVVGCLLAAAASVAPTSVPSVDAACGVSIYRIYYDSPGSDTGFNASLNAEWIQLRNGCTAAKSLTNWTIKDAAGHTYKFGTYALGVGSTVKIHTGSGTNTSSYRYWNQGWYISNNTGDSAMLRSGTRALIDSCNYPGGGASASC